MKFQNYLSLFLGMLFSSVSVYAGNAPTLTTKICGLFFGLVFPFIMPLMVFRLSSVPFVLIAIILESYITHRMLSKPYKFVIPRMFAINLVAVLIELLAFALLAGVFIQIYFMIFGTVFGTKIEQMPFEITLGYPLAIFGAISAIILFYVRWKVFCKMFAWYDKKVNKVRLSQVMLYSVTAGYSFWIFILLIERIFKLNL